MKRIDVLPDDVLLEIFDFCLNMYPSYHQKDTEAWQSLVHVCRQWRSLVLGSPRRLNLRLFCTPETRARSKLDIWPALPLIVKGCVTSSSGTDNIVAALKQYNRVCQVFLSEIAGWQLEEVSAVMQVPFPELTDLRLHSYDKTGPLIPDSFLDGSAPRLQIIYLFGISFPRLPDLLLSAPRLVDLRLYDIPHSGFISPEAMAASLSMLSSLKILTLEYLDFQSSQSRPGTESRSLPPPKRSILPALYDFHFKGVTEYLEDLVTFIDAPQLKTSEITFFNQVDFDCPRLAQFINCSPKLRACHEAHLEYNDSTASVKLRYETHHFCGYDSRLDDLQINISCKGLNRQLSSTKRICNSYFLSAVEDLYIKGGYLTIDWKNDAIENTLWLQLLLPFTAVKNLYIPEGVGPRIAAALQELVGDRITEVLPSLQNMTVTWPRPGPFRENIKRFVTARRLSGQPVAVDVRPILKWYGEEEEEESALSWMQSA